MSGDNKFSGKGHTKIHPVVPYYQIVAKGKSSTISEEKMSPSEKVTPSEEVEKGTNVLNDMEKLVVTICRKDLDNFQGQSTASTGWFNRDHERLKRKCSTI